MVVFPVGVTAETAHGHRAQQGEHPSARLGVPVVPIPSTKRVMWREQNVSALDGVLSAEDLAALDALGGRGRRRP
ncbi:hypothetical protein [Microbispora siamensis]|uniref:Uncharacterized protein n=1 Tax=Microbispora siamensis TaxID=564413 RepID=A0ABQ4GHZ6_9ACTN|nr:hypothetical protein [Microbispora siamensis]GIH61055.1 hypothetical protein Msi02_18720 [Microbispora siamensis]